MIRPVVKAPNKVLSSRARRVTRFDARLAQLLGDMKETLLAARDPEGVGLAAPQIGVSQQIFIMRPKKTSPITICVNPEILALEAGTPADSDSQKTTLEGCLSVDRIWSPIVRPQRVHLKYLDENGAKNERWFEGFEAVIVQHEVDHLHGILFTARAMEQEAALYEEKKGKLHEIEL